MIIIHENINVIVGFPVTFISTNSEVTCHRNKYVKVMENPIDLITFALSRKNKFEVPEVG